ncbi:MAG: Ig-like domain-containing protein [Acidobacteria bacterium]|nr:Ig-like domain-containing protein [Acidobacteriota bacterium]
MSRIRLHGALQAILIAGMTVIGAPATYHQSTTGAAAPAGSEPAPQRKYSLQWKTDPTNTNKVAIEVSGVSVAALRRLQNSNWGLSQWHSLLSVFVESADPGLPPMVGTYHVHPGLLRFEPQFPLAPGIVYRAIFRPDQLPGEVVSSITSHIVSVFQAPPRAQNIATVVSHVYPSAEILPENLLKFYVHFSAPMSRGQVYDHIHLRDRDGKTVELPFLELSEELWDMRMMRLTLFIDPGRIKRGVRPLEEIGAALEEGKTYTLVIESALKDGNGIPLKATFERVIKVGQPDRIPPDHTTWKIQSPKPNTREPLVVSFPEPMDHALAQRMIRVTYEAGEQVEGKAILEDQERIWTFIPTATWQRGAYKLVIQTTIEDLAGNNIGKPFDVDLFEVDRREIDISAVNLKFLVR